MAYGREHRIVRKRDYERVFKEGRKVVRPSLVVYCLAVGTAPSRIGLAVSRKVGRAVVRNRVRRRLKEIFRLHQAQFPGGGWDLVVVARPVAAERDYATLQAELLRAVEKAATLPPPPAPVPT